MHRLYKVETAPTGLDRMRNSTLTVMFFGAGLLVQLATSAWAGDAEVKKLLETKICSDCNLNKADLHDANLNNADLHGANLSEAILTGAKLRNAILRDANLQKANLLDADLSEARLDNANLEEASLVSAVFIKAHLQSTSFKNAVLNDSNFSEAKLELTEFAGASAYGVSFANAVFEPRSLPDFWTMSDVSGLETLKWESTPSAIMTLRKQFKEAGLWKHEKNMTYALREQDRQDANVPEAFAQMVFFRLTSEWGRSALRPILIIFALIPVFFGFYMFALLRPMAHAAIWRVWDKERIEKSEGTQDTERLSPAIGSAVFYGAYFSILSAFHIGWKDLNIGNWIEQFSPWEYKLRGTGWVRTASGVQSIISVYLLALAVLSYFGRPFE